MRVDVERPEAVSAAGTGHDSNRERPAVGYDEIDGDADGDESGIGHAGVEDHRGAQHAVQVSDPTGDRQPRIRRAPIQASRAVGGCGELLEFGLEVASCTGSHQQRFRGRIGGAGHR